jgi:hypothetical protein
VSWLKHNTAADAVIGPFVDDTDFKTPETSLTLSQADCQLIKAAGAAAQKNNATAATHLGGGHYKVPLSTTDTNTLGRLRLYVNEAGALPVWRDFLVLPANVYDALVEGSDALQVHANEMTAGLITSATLHENALAAIVAALLKSDWSGLSGEAPYSVLNALRFLRNDWAVAGDELTVYKEDGSTAAWGKDVSTDVDAPPVTGVSTPA